MVRAFVGVGSNIEPPENVRRALRLLTQELRVVGLSTVYETAPEGRPEQPPYYNCVVEIETDAAAPELKRDLRVIEERLGRRRAADRYAPRTIDLDLLAYDELSVQTPELTLPDPEIATRAYLAAALSELAPTLPMPGIGSTPSELAERLSKRGMHELPEYTAALRREVTNGQ